MTLRNWAGSVAFSTDRLHRPSSVEQLQDLVAGTPRIRALGTGHSFSRVADTTGDLITVADLPPTIEIDGAARTVEVSAGTRYAELAAELDAHGWALHNLGSLPHISVAGACATGTHGSGDANRCLSAAAVAIEFVRGDGELARLTRDDPDFGGAVLSLGALGVATRLTLAIEPTYDVSQQVWLDAPVATVADRLDEVMAAGYSVSLFTAPDRPEVIDQIWVKTRAGERIADGRDWGARAASEQVHPVPGMDPSATTAQLGAPGPWHARLPHFRAEFRPSAGAEQQAEFLVPRVHGPDAVRALCALDLRGAAQVCEVRSIAADELWLSPCHGRDTLGVHVTWVLDDALVLPGVAKLEAALAPFDPRPHWGKVFGLPPEQVRAAYPALPRFRDLAARCDPDRRFGNDFLERYVY